MRQSLTRTDRSGATLVEMAVVLSAATLFFFGIVEFGRFIFVRQVVDNAAREGVRHAVVNVTATGLDQTTRAIVLKRMAGVQNNLRNLEIKLYRTDKKGNNLGSVDNAEFGEYLAVQIDCDYDPALPLYLSMSNTIHIRTKCLMNSEAN